MKNTSLNKKHLWCAVLFAACSTSSLMAQSTTLFLEGWEQHPKEFPTDGLDPDRSIDDYGWKGVREDGTTYTLLTSGWSVVADLSDMTGEWRTHFGGNGGGGASHFIWTDKIAESNASSGGLDELSLQHLESGLTDPGEGYRIAFKIGEAWYVDASVTVTASGLATSTVDLTSTTYVLWEDAPTDDISTFIVPELGDGVALPDGAINSVGLLLVNTVAAGRNEFRIDAIEITGTPGGGASSFVITEIEFVPGDDSVTLTWNSREGESYTINSSVDMSDWPFDLDDGVSADAGTTTTRTYDLSAAGLGGSTHLFFRVVKN